MAVLLVKIEDTASLALNEFFDYNGRCYALAGSRKEGKKEEFRMEEFYEATMDTAVLEGVPVFFVQGQESEVTVIGWYKKAKLTREVRALSLFLEGNVEVSVADVVLLPEKDRVTKLEWQNHSYLYEVVEEEDMRYPLLNRLLQKDPAENAFRRYAFTRVKLEPKLVKQPEACLQYCGKLAQVLIEDQCQDISEIKALELYAKKMMEKRRNDPDGYYYHALACCHLGFFKDGIRSVEKAIALEPEAADLQALKAMLLVEKGYYQDSAVCFHTAYERSAEEEYLLLEGKVRMIAGQMDKAYECFKSIKDKNLLEEAGIQLRDMEKRWSFADFLNIRRRSRSRRKK